LIAQKDNEYFAIDNVLQCVTIYMSMRIRHLKWDDENLEHIIANHGIRANEVEDVCFGPHIVYSVKYHRKAVYGQTSGGKYLMVILERLYNNVFRPITARSMNRAEQRKYRRIMG